MKVLPAAGQRQSETPGDLAIHGHGANQQVIGKELMLIGHTGRKRSLKLFELSFVSWRILGNALPESGFVASETLDGHRVWKARECAKVLIRWLKNR